MASFMETLAKSKVTGKHSTVSRCKQCTKQYYTSMASFMEMLAKSGWVIILGLNDGRAAAATALAEALVFESALFPLLCLSSMSTAASTSKYLAHAAAEEKQRAAAHLRRTLKCTWCTHALCTQALCTQALCTQCSQSEMHFCTSEYMPWKWFSTISRDWLQSNY